MATLLFALQLVHEVDGVVEAHAFAAVDGSPPQGCGQVGFAGAGAADQDQVMRGRHEGCAGQLLDLRLRQGRFGPIKPGQIAVYRKARDLELVAQAADLAIGELGLDHAVEQCLGLHGPPGSLGEPLVPGGGHAVEVQRVELGGAVGGTRFTG
jgi:hypothetical protein